MPQIGFYVTGSFRFDISLSPDVDAIDTVCAKSSDNDRCDPLPRLSLACIEPELSGVDDSVIQRIKGYSRVAARRIATSQTASAR